MPKSTSRSEKPSAKAAGRTRKTAPSPKKKTAVAPKRAKKPRRAAVPVAEPAVEAPELPVFEVAKSTVLDAPVAPGGRLPRRAVFIDVENTSSEDALVSALTHLVIDRQAQPTDVVAVGNWRVISHQVARMLAQRGARLLHSAPATGVKDWSDLSIAVHAGIWLGRSQPGDVIEIVSADRAFDAVADAATTLGVIFRRLTYGAPKRSEDVEDDAGARRGRRSRRGRRGGRRPGEVSEQRAVSSPPTRSAPAARPVAPAEREPDLDVASPDEDRHGASHQQIIAAIARLTAKDPARGVNLDLLTNALKGEGFSRPPGSPRLVTRLRKMKDVEVSTTGMVRLAGVAAPGPAMHAEPIDEPLPAGEAETEAAAEPEGASTPPKRPSPRRRSRGGARRSRGARSGAAKDEGGAPEVDAAGADDAVSRTA
jgi:hypothetical protein